MRAERGRPWMRLRAAAERAQGGTRVRAVTHHAEGLFMAVPLWSWLELWYVMRRLNRSQVFRSQSEESKTHVDPRRQGDRGPVATSV